MSSLQNCKEPTSNIVEPTTFYVGTYTDSQSEGIYQFELHQDGNLQETGLMAKTENPSFLTKSANGAFLLSVNEVSNEENMGYVTSFKIEKDSLVYLDQKPTGGAHPCHITTNEDNFVVTANYTGGNMGLLQLQSNGTLSDLLDVQQHQGQGSHPRQEGPHAHSGWFDNNGNIISIDLGTNQLWFSIIDEKDKVFLPSVPETFTMEEGAGPRHLTFHPSQPWIYVVNELTSSVSLLKKDQVSEKYTSIQTISTLPAEYKEPNTCADIHISNDGKFVYASNRGHNSIAIYKVDPKSGMLEVMGHQATKGETPRNFSLSPDNKFLLVANQHSDNIVSYLRDQNTGLLIFIDEIPAPSPVCILF
ncbi:MAG: lactonase family protein [Flavobacteriaceae bacterium]